jgi:carbon storage regulator
MLVLSRKHGERIFIGEDIVLTIVRIGGNTVRIGIEAPTTMRVVREELQPEAEPLTFEMELPEGEELDLSQLANWMCANWPHSPD